MSSAPCGSPTAVGFDPGPERLSFLDGALPTRFRLRELTLQAGCSHPFRDEDWDDALVVVERGEIELECRAGIRRRFPAGAIMWLHGMNLRALHNPGEQPTVLSAVSRALPGGPSG